jgi:hypothetical protein
MSASPAVSCDPQDAVEQISCNPGFSIIDTCVETAIFTPVSKVFSGTDECCASAGASFNRRHSGEWGQYLAAEDTMFAALERQETDPECTREDCDQGELPACEKCEYIVPNEPTPCWKVGESCAACTTSMSGASFTATTVRFFISITGNTGGTVYATIHDYPSADPDDITEIFREYALDPGGPEDAVVCVADDLQAAEGRCQVIVSVSTTPPPEPE